MELQRIFLIILFDTVNLDDRKLKSHSLQVLLYNFQLSKSQRFELKNERNKIWNEISEAY